MIVPRKFKEKEKNAKNRNIGIGKNPASRNERKIKYKKGRVQIWIQQT